MKLSSSIEKTGKDVDLDESLAEFIGAMLGDGCLSKYFAKCDKCWRHEIAFTGGKQDFEYYKNFLQPTLENHFGISGYLFVRKDDCSTRFHIKSKPAFTFFENLGIEIGKKTEKLKIPKKVLEKNSLCLACIRGIFNTDGTVYLENKKKHRRLRLRLKMNAPKMLCQIKKVLEKNSIFCGEIKKSRKAHVLNIYRKDSIKKFMELVGFSNKHHINRLTLFQNSI